MTTKLYRPVIPAKAGIHGSLGYSSDIDWSLDTLKSPRMVGIILSYCLGILSLQLCSDLPARSLVFLGLFKVCLVTAYLRFKPWTRCCVAFTLGFVAVFLSAESMVQSWIPDALVSRPMEVVGIVDSLPLQKEQYLQFQFKIQSIRDLEAASLWPKPGIVKVAWSQAPLDMGVGQRWRLSLKLKKPHGYANPGSFNLEKYCFEHRLVAEGSVVSKKPFEKLSDRLWDYPLDRLRAWVRNQVHDALEGRPFKGLMIALSMGDQSWIPFEQWQIFKQTGTGHLLAISGLHIGLITGFFYKSVIFITGLLPPSCFALRRTGRSHAIAQVRRSPKPLKMIGAWVGWLFACLYAALSGFSIPSRRAIFMISALMLSLVFKKTYPTSRAYWIALGLVLLYDPLSTLSPGFWLSFAAVGIILYSMGNRLKIGEWWWQGGRIHLALCLGLSPLTLVLFNSCSFISPLANFIAIPCFSFWVVPCCVIGTLTLFFSKTLALALFSMADYGMQGLWPILDYLGHRPYASAVYYPHSSWTLLIAALGLFCVLLPKGLPGRYWGILALLPLLWCDTQPLIKEGTAFISLLDVGQGLASVVQTKNHVLIFDTGPRLSEHFDTGTAVVLPFLQSRKIKTIDCLIISHADNDHKGGAMSIMKAMPVRHIMSSDQPFPDRLVDPCIAGQTWRWDGVLFEILHPTRDYTGKKNDRSCVLKVQAGTQSVLMTGDIESKSETELMTRVPQQLAATVLIVPHHGSKTSSSIDFIKAVHPAYAIITAGYANHYGHPKQVILQRYQEARIPVFDSIHHGAISFTLNVENPLKIEAYRLKNKKFWNPSF